MDRPSPENAIKLYEQAKSLRSPHEAEWRKAAAYCLPAQYASWNSDGPQAHNASQSIAAARRVSYDITGAKSLPKYIAILERLATPVGQEWHALGSSDTVLNKKYRVRKYFDELQRRLFKLRYHPQANFRVSSNEVYGSMGVYGNGPIYMQERSITPLMREPGFMYKSLEMQNMYFLLDDNGHVESVFRRFWLNVRQFKTKFPNEPMPKCMEAESKKADPAENIYFELVHYAYPQSAHTFDEEALDARRHPIHSSYLVVKDKAYVGELSGYRSMPYRIPRVATVSGDAYGYSPAVMSLAALGGASQMKKTNLKQGQKAVDPVLLAHDDGVLNGSMDGRPGAINYGAVNKDGRSLVNTLPTGDYRIGKDMLEDEREDIEDSFFVTLFRILKDRPEMTATQFMGETAEVAALLSPTMGRLQSEFLGPTIERELDMMEELGMMPEMPPELLEAEGEFKITYTSPLAKNINAEANAGFMRMVESSLGIANATGDMSVMDHYNFDVAIPEIAESSAVPTHWMNDDKTKKALREQRAEAAERQQMIDAAPAVAGLAKNLGGAEA